MDKYADILPIACTLEWWCGSVCECCAASGFPLLPRYAFRCAADELEYLVFAVCSSSGPALVPVGCGRIHRIHLQAY